MFFLLLLKFTIGVALAFGKATPAPPSSPPIPSLPQSFRCNFTMNVPLVNPSGLHLFKGYLELEYGSGAGRLHFEGEEFVPVYLETNMAVTPNAQDRLRAYWFNSRTCWYSPADPDILRLWPLIIPVRAVYGGKVACGSDVCQQWAWSEEEFGGVTMNVLDAEPHDVRQVSILQQGLFGIEVVFNVFNTVVGLPPKRDLQPPNMQCIRKPVGVQSPVLLGAVAGGKRLAGPAPPIPKIARQFSASYTLSGSYGKLLTNSTLITGEVWFDDVNGAGRITFNSTDTPMRLETNVIANPHGEIITGYVYEKDLCWQKSVSKDFLKILPLEIPKDAKYLGAVKVRGASCTKWSFKTSQYASEFIYVVRDADGALVEVVGQTGLSSGLARLSIYNYKIGPISPSSHQPPKGFCWTPPFEAK